MGALSARQYTEVQDAVRALVSDMGKRSTPGLASPKPILGRILGPSAIRVSTPGPGTVDGSTRIAGTVYAFEELHVRLTTAGIEIAPRPYGISTYQGEGWDESRAMAVHLVEGSILATGTLVTLYPVAIDMGEDGNQVPVSQTVFIIIQVQEFLVRSMFIQGVLQETGKYMASTSMASGGSEPVEITNIYETSNHYGASLIPSNPNECATIVPKRLGLGDEVFVYQQGDGMYTMAPTRFESECVPCETSPLAMNSTEIANAIEMSAATIVMR